MFEVTRMPGNTNPIPSRGSNEAAGFDLQYNGPTIPIFGRLSPYPNRKILGTGFKIRVPKGYRGLCCSRSGLAVNHGVFVLNAPGIIDSDYRGEIKVILCNSDINDFWVEPGMRIAQILIDKDPAFWTFSPFGTEDLLRNKPLDVKEVESFDITARNENGFGSTGTGEIQFIGGGKNTGKSTWREGNGDLPENLHD